MRFNFRGVGRSEGSFGGGTGEIADVLGALARVRKEQDGPLAVVGWSFGALVSLNAVARDGAIAFYCGIAPPVGRALSGKMELPPISELDCWSARSLIVCGTEDPYCRPGDAEELARHLPPPFEVRVIEGADHMFSGNVDDLCSVVIGFVAGSER